jgi:hypothetical protein
MQGGGKRVAATGHVIIHQLHINILWRLLHNTGKLSMIALSGTFKARESCDQGN